MSAEEQQNQSCIPDELKKAAEGEKKFEYGDKPDSSIFARDDAPVHNVPMAVIRRPLPSELDEAKVQAFMEEMKVSMSYVVCGLASSPAAPFGRLRAFW